MTRLLIALLLAVGVTFVSPSRAAGPVAVGDIAPDFTLEDQAGRKHRLAAERDKRPVVLVFYRGYW